MQATPRHLMTHGLALAGAAAWGLVEFVALCRSRWWSRGASRGASRQR